MSASRLHAPASSVAPRRHAAVVGLQWGDEGKGKIVDLLTAEHDVIVRYNGGANAGHTVVVGGERYALHLIPSGILYPGKECVIGNGVVVDPATLRREMETLRGRDVVVEDNLRLSDRAHVVMPWHPALDVALERFLAAGTDDDRAIGTTGRGIGPAYADKVTRSTALRVGDLLHPDRLRRKVHAVLPMKKAALAALGVECDLAADPIIEAYVEHGQVLRPHVVDTTYLLHERIAEGRSILMEGANASLLDVDHGTYPYVTSSHCSTLGIAAGTGVPFRDLNRVIGIMKAYATRVGGGPFPTELNDHTAERIRERGREYGTTTGRPRRCGWLDLVAVRYSAMICGVTEVACMLLDVLSGFDELRICTAYRLPDGRTTDRFLPDADSLAGVTPVYETLPGWAEPIEQMTDRAALPANARAYLDRISEFLGVPIEIVSVGPERTQTLRSTRPAAAAST